MVAPLRATPIVRSISSDFQRHIQGLCRPASTRTVPAVVVPAPVQRRMEAIKSAAAPRPVVMGSAGSASGSSPFGIKTVIGVKPRYGAVRHDVADYGGGQAGQAKKKRKMVFDGAAPAVHVPGRALGSAAQPAAAGMADVIVERTVAGGAAPAPTPPDTAAPSPTTSPGPLMAVPAIGVHVVPAPKPPRGGEAPQREKGGQRRRRLPQDL